MSSDLRINGASSVIAMSNNSAIALNQLSIHSAQAKVESAENQFFADMKERLANILTDSAQLRNRITAISSEMRDVESQKKKAASDDLIEQCRSSAENMRKINAELTQKSEGLTAETIALASSIKQLNQCSSELRYSNDTHTKELFIVRANAEQIESLRREFLERQRSNY